jgi:hypothetical protein
MKIILLAAFSAWILSGCFIFKKKEVYGCPTNGKNVGAERLLSGDKAAIRAAKKAKKFKS